jgi:hypothetical protein
MTLKIAINLFNRLVSESTKKSEIKVYREFIEVLTNLENRSFTKSEIQSIETELDLLTLNTGITDKKRYFRQMLQQFKKYLKDTYSLVTKGYYINLGITFGASAGLLFGILFLSGSERSLGIALGISVGALIGLISASYLETQAKASGNLI